MCFNIKHHDKIHFGVVMKKLILLLACLSFISVKAQWEECNNGLYGVIVNDFAKDNDLIFVATKNGIFVTSDLGLSWEERSNSLQNKDVLCLAVLKNKIYAGTNGGGIFISTDKGGNWKPINNGLKTLIVNNIVINSNEEIYISTFGGGIFVSTYTSESWNDINKGLNINYEINSLIIKNDYLFAGLGKSGLYLSTTKGKNWIRAKNGIEDKGIYSLGVVGNNIYVNTESGSYSSTNNGMSWQKTKWKFPSNGFSSIVGNDSLMFSAVDSFFGGVYTYTAGKNWEQICLGFKNNCITKLFKNEDLILAGTDGGGIYISTDNGINWYESYIGITCPNISKIAFKDNLVFSASYNGLFYSTNECDSWTEQKDIQSPSYFHSVTTNSQMVYARSYYDAYRSSDNGNSWEKIDFGLEKDIHIKFLIATNQKVFAFIENHGFYFSEDNGLHWEFIDGEPFSQCPYCYFYFENTLIFGFYNFLYVSNDIGVNWYKTRKMLNDTTIYSVTYSNNKIYIGTDKGIFSSIDKGITWNIVGNNNISPRISSIYIVNDIIFVGTRLNGLYKNINGDTNWISLIADVPSKCINTITRDSNYIYCGTQGGLFRAKLSDFGITSVDDNITSESNLFDIYPNPANTKITISSSEKFEKADISIFNLIGEKVASFQCNLSENQSLDISNLDAGIYYCMIQSSKFYEYKKLVIVR